MPRGKSALGFSQREMSENKLKTQNELLDDMCVLLGGRVAEELFCHQITTGASDDIQKLTNLAYLYVTYYGMDKRLNTFYYNQEENDRYSEYLRKNISIETLVILDKILGFKKNFDKKLSDPVWISVSMKLEKYSPFLNIDIFKYKKILKKVVIGE